MIRIYYICSMKDNTTSNGETKMKINHTELALKLSLLKSSFVGLTTETKQSALNKGKGASSMLESISINPDEIKKHTKLVGLIGTGVTYETMVENRLVKEGTPKDEQTFEAGKLPWGAWVIGAEKLLLKHKGSFYLRVYCVANNVPQVEYKLNGSSIDIKDSKFDQWRAAEKVEGDKQGLEKPIVVRSYGFDSIKEITLNGETYEVIPD